MRRLNYLPPAIEDLENIRRWYSQPGSGAAARRRVQLIRAGIRALKKDPVLWPRGAKVGTRELHVEGHTVVYTVDPDTGLRKTAGNVTVLRVFGPGQDRSSFGEED
jgi:plasmid stabilization system protein ParE